MGKFSASKDKLFRGLFMSHPKAGTHTTARRGKKRSARKINTTRIRKSSSHIFNWNLFDVPMVHLQPQVVLSTVTFWIAHHSSSSDPRARN
ncbi:unnamed protein product [Cercopithifilaria johnstoni]|uniref:Uncharacterized protein n=1 Tax=Cercopithifilaria johnstoni TaxID=2874296 RepID=A0A8J2MCS9_9BILA|nr:unnamed protein product [Cercopithifilaria johnstoni]